MTAALLREQAVAAALDHDWIVHVDADEWLHPLRPRDRLIDLFTRAERDGDRVVAFRELTFVPDRELRPFDDPRKPSAPTTTSLHRSTLSCVRGGVMPG